MVNKMTVLISGCSSGLGLALAKEYASKGHLVFATARKPASISNYQSTNFHISELDVTSKESIQRCVTSIIEAHGRIDILINNAGFAQIGPISELDIEDMKNQYNTNVFGAVELSQAVIPYMIKHQNGRIINISSISGIVTTPFAGSYCSSKAALSSISDAMRIELKPFGISIIDIQMGKVSSSFGETAYKDAVKYQNKLSPYKDISEFIVKRAEISQKNACDASIIASKIYKYSTNKKSRSHIKISNESFKLPFMKSVLPSFIFDKILAKTFGLDRINKN